MKLCPPCLDAVRFGAGYTNSSLLHPPVLVDKKKIKQLIISATPLI